MFFQKKTNANRIALVFPKFSMNVFSLSYCHESNIAKVVKKTILSQENHLFLCTR